ncbi:MAG: endo alpha-1,4 polygalactosaminidase [Campylobacterota bacterium]|nr:endo alpha-1,4 polygalactosaminidase [Campylobacterota bacterium]
MKHLCCVRLLSIIIFSTLTLHASLTSKSAVVYYSDDVPYSLVGIHDYIILQPSHVNTATHGFKTYKENIYAYASIGEVESNANYYADIRREWILGENKIWRSKVLDISNLAYHNFLFEQVFDPMRAEGFQNFFFDTLDSYHIVAKSDKERKVMREGLIRFIKSFHQRYPQSKLIVNRGFEIIDDIHDSIEGVLFESLFKGLSSKDLSYTDVSQEDRSWLLAQVKKIQAYNKPIIALDYVEDTEGDIAKSTVKEIEKLGLIPYIGDRDLVEVGISSKNAQKREVLLLYDGTEFDNTQDDDSVYSAAFLQLSSPLEYMGYVPILHDISLGMFSPSKLKRYAGAVVWMSGDFHHSVAFIQHIEALLKSQLKVLFINTLIPQLHTSLFDKLQINIIKVSDSEMRITQTYESAAKLVSDDAYMGYEIDPFIPNQNYYFSIDNAQKIVEVITKEKSSTIAAITSWGGYAFGGTTTLRMQGEDLWIANPFKLMKDALRLPDLMVPDPTTENGKRLLFVHMDGDGIMNRAEWNLELFSGEVLYEEIFSRYNIPMSLSIIEGETAPYGLYGATVDKTKDISLELENISRDIFALENVEPASHTFTHPFFWNKIIDDNLDEKYRLKVKNYDFSLAREIGGSLDYINKNLTPKNKTAKMIFWSGDCLPTESTLDYMYKNDFLHINGGDTTITNANPWLSRIAPYGIRRGDYYQIFTGAQNENVYTNDWLGPFWGFKKVIQTFKLTDSPKRFKPIDIYFHTYSGSKKASLKALDTVLKWAIQQDTMPIYTSAYIPKVMDFYDIALAHEGDTWLIKGDDNLKTLRVPKSVSVNFKASKGVVGIKKHDSIQYVHLDHNKSQLLVLNDNESDQNYLIDANVALKDTVRNDRKIDLQFKGEVPAIIRYHIAHDCSYDVVPRPDDEKLIDGVLSISYKKEKELKISITCKKAS